MLFSLNEPKEVTIEKLRENHGELINEIIKVTYATPDLIAITVKYSILAKQNDYIEIEMEELD